MLLRRGASSFALSIPAFEGVFGMFEGYTEKQIVEMIRAALKSPERRAELMRLLNSIGLLPQEVPDKK